MTFFCELELFLRSTFDFTVFRLIKTGFPNYINIRYIFLSAGGIRIMAHCVYLIGFIVYSVIPFAGGKNRTLANSLLFMIQYTLVFGAFLTADWLDFSKYHGAEVDDIRNKVTFMIEKLFKKEISSTDLHTNGFFITMIVITWLLFFLTLFWYLKKPALIVNDIDYLDRNVTALPGYHQQYFKDIITKNHQEFSMNAQPSKRTQPNKFKKRAEVMPTLKRRFRPSYKENMQQRFWAQWRILVKMVT